MSAFLLYKDHVNFHPEYIRAIWVLSWFHPNLRVIKQIHPFHILISHQDNKELANKCKHGRQCNHWHHVGSQDTCTCCYSHVAISLYHQELHQVTNPQNSPIHLLSKIPDMGRIGNHFDQIKCRVITSLEYSTIMYHMYIQ